MGNITKKGVGQIYIDGQLIPGENLIDFISDMNNDRMLTLPSVWQYNDDLTNFLNYLKLLNNFDHNNKNDTMNYAYLKFLAGRYNDFVKQTGGSDKNLLITLKHTDIKDPFQELKDLQKSEWTEFL